MRPYLSFVRGILDSRDDACLKGLSFVDQFPSALGICVLNDRDPCRSPVPAPGGAVNLLRFDGTVSTLSLPLGNDARGVPLLLRVVRSFPRVFLAADPLLGVALFVLRVFLLFVFAMNAPQAALRSIRCGFGV